MEIRFNVDIKKVRQAFALAEMDVPTDEEIADKFANNVVDLSEYAKGDADVKQAELGVTLMAISQIFTEK